jgi:hypothetical protein
MSLIYRIDQEAPLCMLVSAFLISEWIESISISTQIMVLSDRTMGTTESILPRYWPRIGRFINTQTLKPPAQNQNPTWFQPLVNWLQSNLYHVSL